MKRYAIIAILTALIVAVSPFSAFAEDDPQVIIGGRVLPQEPCVYDCATNSIVDNLDHVTSDSFAAYDGAGALTLHNYSGPFIEALHQDLSILCEGENTIGSEDYPVETGIYLDSNDLYISGNGSLKIYFKSNGLNAGYYGVIIIEEGEITLKNCMPYTVSQDMNYIYCKNLFLKGGKITAESDAAVKVYCNGYYMQYDGSEMNIKYTTGSLQDSFGLVVYYDMIMDGGVLNITSDNGGITADRLCMNGGKINITAVNAGLSIDRILELNGGDLTIEGGSGSSLSPQIGIVLRSAEALFCGGKVSIPGNSFTTAIFDDGSSDISFTGGEHDITGSASAVYIIGELKFGFTDGYAHFSSSEGPALVTGRGITLENGAAFSDAAMKIFGVMDPTASLVPAGTQAMWSVYTQELDPDITIARAKDLAARDVTVLPEQTPAPQPQPDNPVTGTRDRSVVLFVAMVCLAVIWASSKNKVRNIV
ncbi:MAG: carbohydrate-binding domain-containing protein [Eubacteriaceae bacterium]|nr:carbohydrate-binding domain-containing protein [Eubacteriaceae bacterium]